MGMIRFLSPFQETGEKVLQVDMKKYQVYGGQKIALEKDEVDQLKTNIAKEGDDAGTCFIFDT